MADIPAPPAAERSHDRRVSLGVAALVLATVALAHLAPGGHPAPAVGPDRDPGCLEWTDSCVVCVRGTEGPNCSLPGIACTRGPQRCLRR
ncbi:hypothetical protein [uncultured Methylobacterium sp.]|jgi:hypothetical protein|uniref:hypothetical protein n=1 Tax=uncultured Methylobacterium sp. TaxID=157278 RepID=UPI002628F6B4|nr:hypothetical protein [uncultured Methylobacterium sp.]